MIKSIVKISLLSVILISCSTPEKNEQINESTIISNTDTENEEVIDDTELSEPTSHILQKSFVFEDDSVVLPTFEIKIDLSKKANEKIINDKESIIVYAEFSGQPKDTTSKEYAEWKKIQIGTHKIELINSRIAKFENIRISKEIYQSLEDKNFEVLINVFSGRKSTPENVLDCDIYQDGINSLKGTRYILKGDLIFHD